MTAKLHHSITALLLCVLGAFVVQTQAQIAIGTAAFQRLDKNADGKLTRDEAPSADSFAAADADKDGAVTLDEFRRYLANRSKPSTPAPAKPNPTRPAPARAAANALFETVDAPGFSDTKGEINGLALGDLNCDGLLDIVRTHESGLTVLLNQGGFRFKPHRIQVRNPDSSQGQITRKAEVPNLVDFNRDGHLDLLLTCNRADTPGAVQRGRKGNQLLVSDGAWDHFVDLSEPLGVRNELAYNRQSSSADVNGDGWLDIGIGCDNIVDGTAGVPHSRLHVFKPKGAKFEDGRFEDIGGTALVPGFGGFYGDPDKDRAGPGILLRDLDNDGDLDLVQGYHMDTWGRITGKYPVAFYDYGIFCWKNLLAETGEFRFERIRNNGIAQRGKLKIRAPYDYDVVEPAVALPFISSGDVDNDGLLEVIAIGSCQPSFFAGWASGKSGQFYRNRGGFLFEEATDRAGLGSLNWTNEEWLNFFGIPITETMRASSTARSAGPAAGGWLNFKIYGGNAVFADFNNDGWLDVHVANRKWSYPQSIFRNVLYLNNGDGIFRLLKSEESGIYDNCLFAEAADLDNDGLLDLVYARDPANNSPIIIDAAARDEWKKLRSQRKFPPGLDHSLILRNRGQFGGKENHWLRLRFTGITHAELGGARVEIYEPGEAAIPKGKRVGSRIVFSSHHHKAGTPMEVHFGLGKQTKADVKVTLPSGKTLSLAGLKVIAALIHKNGVRGYFEMFGLADIEAGKPMPKDAIVRLMSMTKPVIAVAALTLLDEGKFTLDEPISKHLPEWKEPKVMENGQVVPAKYAITPRMLMSHSSGLYYGSGDGGAGKAGKGNVAAVAFKATRGASTTLKEFSEAVAKEPLKFQPGTGYNYGLGIDILGRYIEAVASKPLDEALKERLFRPLKMADTDFWVPPAKAGRICQLYRQPKPGVLEPGRDGAKLTDKPTLFLGGHGLCSTTGDYERFCRMILNRGELDGVRVLKPETVDLIFQDHLKHPTMKYGLGGVVDGEGSYGWGGADGTQFVIDRKHNFFVLFMVQTQHYKAPTYPAFLALANEAAGIAGGRAGATGGGGAGGMNNALKQRDKNNDGKLDREELPGALFDRLDANRDGFVTEDELKSLWKAK